MLSETRPCCVFMLIFYPDIANASTTTTAISSNMTAAAASRAASLSVDSSQSGVGEHETPTKKMKRISFWDMVEREQTAAKRARLANEGVDDNLKMR